MRAVRYERYGPPEVLEVRKVPVPVPRSGEVLVKVHATSVNPVEAQVRSGRMRPMSGYRFPKGTGEDFAGEVVAVGPGVDATAVGRLVWGTQLGLNSAAAAEYIRVKESATAAAPPGLGAVAAATLPTVGLTALTALRAVRVPTGGKLLVVGASGGIGSVTVQLARAAGTRVATVSSERNLGLCRDLGAEWTYDHTRLDRLPAGPEFDSIVDLHGACLSTYRERLKRGGRMTTMAAKGMAYALLSVALPGPRVRLARMKPSRAGLDELAGLVERGELRPVVDQVYPLEAIADAHRSVETGHSRGKRAVRVAGD
ncbi:MAG TPA: NAD(P)-dependent alcohol dehydrogenase [Kribbella sp.]|nr:NAD(P)-dependent alcohol dehydrogenase [Kribbella sp.]